MKNKIKFFTIVFILLAVIDFSTANANEENKNVFELVNQKLNTSVNNPIAEF